MANITAYLNFDGNTREAMEFYRQCLGGELFIQTVAETPHGAQCAEGLKNQIMHSSLTKGSLLVMASDMIHGGKLNKGNNVSLCINCESEEEINSVFLALAEGGKVIEPLKPQFWGAVFGFLTDKFGIQWMLNYEQPKDLN